MPVSIVAVVLASSPNPGEFWPKLLLTYGPCALFVFFAYVLEKKANERMKATPDKWALRVIYYSVWILMFSFAVVITVVWINTNISAHEFRIHGKLAGLRGEEELRTHFKQMYVRREYENPSHFDYDWLILSPNRLAEGSLVQLVIDRSTPPNHEDIVTYKLPISSWFYDSNNAIELQYNRAQRTISFDPEKGATVVLKPVSYESTPQEIQKSKVDKWISQVVEVVYAQSTPNWKDIAERLQSPDPIMRLDARSEVAGHGPEAIPFIQDILLNPKAPYFLKLGAISALNKMPNSSTAQLKASAWCAIVHTSAVDDEALKREAQGLLSKNAEIVSQDTCKAINPEAASSSQIVIPGQSLQQDKDLGVWRSLFAFKAATNPSERGAAQIALRKAIWEAQALPTIHVGNQGHHIAGFSFSPDGTKMITLQDGSSKTVDIWDVESGRLLGSVSGHKSPVLTATFSPDNKTVVTGTRDGKATFWEIGTGKQSRVIDNQEEIAHISISSDGKRMVVSGGPQSREASAAAQVHLWNIGTQATKPSNVPTGIHGSVTAIEFSPDGAIFALGTINGDVLLYSDELGMPRLKKWLLGDLKQIHNIAFSSKGGKIAVLDESRHVAMWETTSYRSLKISSKVQGAIDAIAFASDDTLFVTAVGSNGKELTVSDAQSGDDKQKMGLRLGFNSDTWISGFSTDAKLLAIIDKHRQWLRIYAQDTDRMIEFAKRYVQLHRKLTDSECARYFQQPTCSTLP